MLFSKEIVQDAHHLYDIDSQTNSTHINLSSSYVVEQLVVSV